MPRARAPILVAALVMVVWGASPALTKIAARGLLRRSRSRVLRTLLAGLVAAPIVLADARAPAGRPAPAAAAPGVRHLRVRRVPDPVHGRPGAHLGDAREHDPRRAADLHRRLRGDPRPAAAGAGVGRRQRAGAGRRGGAGRDPHRRRRRRPRPLGGDALVVLSAMRGRGRLRGRARDSARAATARWPRRTGASSSARCWCVPAAGRHHRGRTGCPTPARKSWAAMLWMAVVTSIVGYIGWYWALARGGIQRIATIQFLQPFSGLLIAAWLLGRAVHRCRSSSRRSRSWRA